MRKKVALPLMILVFALVAGLAFAQTQTQTTILPPGHFAPEDRQAVPMASPGLASGLIAAKSATILVDGAKVARARETTEATWESGKAALMGVNVALDPIAVSTWERLESDNGARSWRIAISSPGATFLWPHFTRPLSEVEGTVLVYGVPDAAFAMQARPTKTARTEGFWGPFVAGDLLHVEVVTDSDRPPQLVVDFIGHGIRKVSGEQKESNCYLDPTCFPAWSPLKSAVGLMLISSGLGVGMCTGSLIMDTAETFSPWFLTANHCLSRQGQADSLVIIWNFHTDQCDGPVPNAFALPTSEGSEVMFTNRQYDETLLLLDQPPPDGTAYLGWTLASPKTGDDITVIHHPAGAWLRISFGNTLSSAGSFWNVRYDQSSTEGGSSGSALLNADQQLIGTLTSGTASCMRMQGTDNFGKFSGAWDRGMLDILSNGGPPADDDDDNDTGGDSEDDDEPFVPLDDDDDSPTKDRDDNQDDDGCGCFI